VIVLRKILILVISLSAALASCQSGAAAKKLNVELGDFTITPNQFIVQAGSEVTISITNNGTVEHDFNIMKSGADIGDMFNERDRANVLWETDVQPGETKAGTFTVPEETGTYQVVCAMPGHMQAGMVGRLEVVNRR
jgi:uncharacterized cupredoxin-like copper-binding protein